MATLSEVRSVKKCVTMLSLVFFIVQMVLAMQKYIAAPKATVIGRERLARLKLVKVMYCMFMVILMPSSPLNDHQKISSKFCRNL